MSLGTTAVEGQTILVHPSARFMPLRVFDATGKLMAGTIGVSDPAEPMAVTFLYQTSTSRGDSFTLRIKAPLSDGPLGYYWAPLPIDTFYFESDDCSGQPYVESPGLMAGRRVAVPDTATNLLYLSEPKPTVVAAVYQSLRHPLDSCERDLGAQSILAVAVNPVIDMDNAFTQPFEIR
jgi:hypothetical protein